MRPRLATVVLSITLFGWLAVGCGGDGSCKGQGCKSNNDCCGSLICNGNGVCDDCIKQGDRCGATVECCGNNWCLPGLNHGPDICQP